MKLQEGNVFMVVCLSVILFTDASHVTVSHNALDHGYLPHIPHPLPFHTYPTPATAIYLVVVTGDLLKLVHLPSPHLVLTSSGGHRSGRYAFYWNAFLFYFILKLLGSSEQYLSVMYVIYVSCCRSCFQRGLEISQIPLWADKLEWMWGH